MSRPWQSRHLNGVVSGALGALLLLSGCADGQGTEGDCNARIVYQGVTYRNHNELNQSAPVESSELGEGDVVGCGDEEDREVVDQVSVHRVTGVDVELAIAVTASSWSGVYVVEGLKLTDWPTQLRLPAE